MRRSKSTHKNADSDSRQTNLREIAKLTIIRRESAFYQIQAILLCEKTDIIIPERLYRNFTY